MKIDLLVSQMQNKAQETNSGILGFSENEIVLFQNNPNPFSTDTEIRMVLPETSKQADLIIYNLEGKQLKAINIHERGNVVTKILSYELSAGMYMYTLIVDSKVIDTKRMILK